MPTIRGVDRRTKTKVAVPFPHPTVDMEIIPLLSYESGYSVIKEVFLYAKEQEKFSLSARRDDGYRGADGARGRHQVLHEDRDDCAGTRDPSQSRRETK